MQQYRNPQEIRAAAALDPSSYEAATLIDNAHQANQLVLYVDLTLGDSDYLEIKIEDGHNGGDKYQEMYGLIDGSTGVETLQPAVKRIAQDGLWRIPVSIKAHQILVSVKGATSGTGSSCAISAVLGIQ